jgi:hypothetical protein
MKYTRRRCSAPLHRQTATTTFNFGAGTQASLQHSAGPLDKVPPAEPDPLPQERHLEAPPTPDNPDQVAPHHTAGHIRSAHLSRHRNNASQVVLIQHAPVVLWVAFFSSHAGYQMRKGMVLGLQRPQQTIIVDRIRSKPRVRGQDCIACTVHTW